MNDPAPGHRLVPSGVPRESFSTTKGSSSHAADPGDDARNDPSPEHDHRDQHLELSAAPRGTATLTEPAWILIKTHTRCAKSIDGYGILE
jgi:hypothetical protein